MPTLRYGKTTVSFEIPKPYSYDIIAYLNDDTDSLSELQSVSKIRQALEAPIGTPRLRELAAGQNRAVILISDGTRLCPSQLLLEPLLEELNSAGMADSAIDIVVALGLHRKHTAEELQQLVGGGVYRRIRVHNHSSEAEDCVYVGTTSLGTPIEINRLVAETPFRIVTGNIEPHALVGISGGIKAIIPGVASHRSIEMNHSLSLKIKASPGQPDNDIHRDLEEALQFLPVDFILNVIVNHERQVLEAVAGNIVDAHRAGVSLAARRFVVPVKKLYDVVIVSPGGAPKDLQLYQSLKALCNAASFTKSGGTLIMAAECPEMLGNGIFQFWVETMPDRDRMVSKLHENFVLGAHKILHVDEVLRNHHVYLHSSLPNHLTQLLGFTPAQDLQAAVTSVLNRPDLLLAVMPFGSLTYAAK